MASREPTARLSGGVPGWKFPGTRAHSGDMVELYPQTDPQTDWLTYILPVSLPSGHKAF